jgi:hypothetical protein
MNKNMLVVRSFFSACLLGLPIGAVAQDSEPWESPVGIPHPDFGISESHLMYSGLVGYNDAGFGPYTIYVNNSDPGCSDSGPATEEKPRCSIPDKLDKPGSVVEIHGGPYELDYSKPVLNANGTPDQPVFIRGTDDGAGYPVIRDGSTYAFQGKYLVVENLIFENTSVRTGSREPAEFGRNHISLRNLEVAHHQEKNGTGLGGDHIVFYNNHVHHNIGDDRHGTTVARGSQNIWIIDNRYHHNGGDAVQFCHRCRKSPPTNVFIGRNVMYSDRENAVDLKFGKNIVISENTMYGYRTARKNTEWCFDDQSHCGRFSSGSDGSAIVVGSDGAPRRPWILFNHIYDSVNGIRIEEVRDAWVIGNTIHDISNRAVSLQKDGAPLHFTGNVIFDSKIGIDQYWRDNFALHVHGNVFSNVEGNAISVNGRVASQSTVSGNQFWSDEGKIRIDWGGKSNQSAKTAGFIIRGGGENFVADPGITNSDSGYSVESLQSEVVATEKQYMLEHSAAFTTLFGKGSDLKLTD